MPGHACVCVCRNVVQNTEMKCWMHRPSNRTTSAANQTPMLCALRWQIFVANFQCELEHRHVRREISKQCTMAARMAGASGGHTSRRRRRRQRHCQERYAPRPNFWPNKVSSQKCSNERWHKCTHSHLTSHSSHSTAQSARLKTIPTFALENWNW